MTDELSIGLTKLLREAQTAEDVDFLREGMRVFSEAVMEREVTRHVGAERHARTAAGRGRSPRRPSLPALAGARSPREGRSRGVAAHLRADGRWPARPCGAHTSGRCAPLTAP
jgi:hypothetical protein